MKKRRGYQYLKPFRFTKNSESDTPVDNAGYFGFSWIHWLTPTVQAVFKDGIDADVPQISKYETVAHCGQHIQECLDRENAKEKPSFPRAVWRSVRGMLIMYFVAYTLWGLTMMMSATVGVVCIVSYVNAKQHMLENPDETFENSTYFQQNKIVKYKSMPTLTDGLLFVLLLFVFEVVRANLYSLMFAIAYRKGQRLRSGLNWLVINKVLRLRGGKGEKSGEILNIISADGDRLVDGARGLAAALVPFIIFIVAVIVGLIVIGWPSLLGNFVVFLSVPIFLVFGRLMIRYRTDGSELSGKRIELLSEVLSSIRLIKMFDWADYFFDRVKDIRKSEASCYYKMNTSACVLFGINTIVATLAAVVTFATMDSLGMELPSPEEAFLLISVWNVVAALLRLVPIGLASLANTRSAIQRVEQFLQKDELKHYIQELPENSQNSVEIENATLRWNDERASLENVTITVPKGKTVVLTGSVGAGKSSVLASLTNQMLLDSGTVSLSSSKSYAPQEPWLMAGTIRENILFGSFYDHEWYGEVISSCGLLPDLAQLDEGDNTNVGQEGIALSGGQRARIGLARAIYRKSDLILLDDPLSAVDRHVSKLIWETCVKKLLKDCSVLITTHQLNYINTSDYIYNIEDGKVAEHGTPDELLTDQSDIGQRYHRFIATTNKKEEKEIDQSEPANQDEEILEDNVESDELADPSTSLIKANGKIDGPDTEVRPAANIWTYYECVKNGPGFTIFIILFLLYLITLGMVQGIIYWFGLWMSVIRGTGNCGDDLPENSIWADSNFYFWVMVISAVLIILTTIIRAFLYAYFVRKMVDWLVMGLVTKILQTKQSFFDITPKGEIMARFSKDQEEIETYLPILMDNCFCGMFILLFIFILISISMPFYLVPILVVSIPTYFLVVYAWRSIDAFKRRDLLSRSPWYSQTIAFITGLPVIRTFKKETESLQEFCKLQDANSSYYFLFFCALRWFTSRADIVSVFLSGSCALYIVLSNGVCPDLAGASLALSLQISVVYQMFLRLTMESHSRMSSAQCILLYGKKLPIEENLTSGSDQIPSDDVPAIKFSNVNMSYRKGLPNVLCNVNLTIQPGEHVGIVGRTGSGKSSLFTALYHLSDCMDGLIDIRGLNVNNCSLGGLRRSLSLIPQDPTLFSGTVRFNLDPEERLTDEECIAALETCGLWARIEKMGGLNGEMERGGANLSIGERQLFCMARALLRKVDILLLDEATASVDGDTDSNIQNVLRNQFKLTTVLTIAHRLNTIEDYDKILVMDNGKIAEFDSPATLLKDSNGLYYKLVNN